LGLSKTSIFLIFCAVIAAVLGMIGFSLEDRYWEIPEKPKVYDPLGGFIDAAYKTLRIFILEGPKAVTANSDITIADISLNIARFLGPLSLAGALFQALTKIWATKVTDFRTRWSNGHIIVFGDSEMANLFKAKLSSDSKVISIVEKGEQFKISIVDSEKPTENTYSSNNPEALWKLLAANKSKAIILVDNDDHKNLLVAKSLEKIGLFDRSSGPRVFVHVGDYGLRQELVKLNDPLDLQRIQNVEIFSVSELAARSYFHERNFFYDTIKRNQDRVHWLVVGNSEIARSFVDHFLEISPHPDLKPPLISLVSDAKSFEYSNLISIANKYPNLCEVKQLDTESFGTALTSGDFKKIIDTPLTALLITEEHALGTALRLKRLANKDPLLNAPIILADITNASRSKKSLSDVSCSAEEEISSAVDAEALCSLETLMGGLDKTAEALHQNYLATIKMRDSKKFPSHKSWDELGEHFRRSNRRAADHAKTKFEAQNILGNHTLSLPGNFDFSTLSPTRLEALAKCEHDSWNINRLLSGWEYASQRDDLQQLHPNLVDYSELDEDTKDKDREQIFTLFRDKKFTEYKKQSQQTISVGVIGRNQITQEEANYIRQSLLNKILPELIQTYGSDELSFYTPLAPGSDLIAAQTIEEFFKTNNHPYQVRIVESASFSKLAEAYLNDAKDGNCWGFDATFQPAARPLSGDITSVLEAFANRHCKINICTSRTKSFSSQLKINAEYFSSKMDLLLAYQGSRKKGGKSGTIETVANAKQNGIETMII